MNENLRRGDIILYKVTNDDPQRKVIIVSRATKKDQNMENIGIMLQILKQVKI